jgi:hypothetical protein
VPYPTAADLNVYLIQQQHIVKPSDESVTSSITLQNDDHLVLPVSANTKYFVQGMLIYTGATAGDMGFKWSVPTGSTFDWCSDALGSAATSLTDQISHTAQASSNQPSFGAIDASTAVAPIKGLLIVGSSGGNLRATWAQGTSSGTATTMKAGSYVMARRVI